MRPTVRTGEEGFTIIEMVVTALILTLGAAAVFGLLAAATKNTQRAKGTQVALDRAQQELEALRGMPNDKLALTSMPSHAGQELNPDFRVAEGDFAVNRTPPNGYAPMVVEGDALEKGGVVEGAAVDPGPEPFNRSTATWSGATTKPAARSAHACRTTSRSSSP
jgi:type II secretory pathway pseudopilin PulG